MIITQCCSFFSTSRLDADVLSFSIPAFTWRRYEGLGYNDMHRADPWMLDLGRSGSRNYSLTGEGIGMFTFVYLIYDLMDRELDIYSICFTGSFPSSLH